MKKLTRLTAALLAVIFAAICFAGCGKKDEVVDIDANPEYGATIDPANITENQAKSVIAGIAENAIYYQSFVTDPSLSTTFRLSNVDYTLEENEGYYPLSTKYGLTSYDNLLFGLRRYFSPEYAESLISKLKGTDPETGKEVERYKMIGGVLHIYPEFSSTINLKEITATFDTFTITEKRADGFTIRVYAYMDDTEGTQEVRLKKIDGAWYVDGIFI